MTFAPPFQRPFSATFDRRAAAAAAASWWLAGGVAAANCLAAYTPKGAASLATSYDNNAAPGNGLADGTYDATAGVAPTFNAATGWTFNGSTQYLNTSVIPSNVQANNSVIVRFSDHALPATGWTLGVRPTVTDRFGTGPALFWWNGNIQTPVATPVNSGVLAIAGNSGYLDGVLKTAALTAWVGVSTYPIWIGCMNNIGAFVNGASTAIQAVAIYNTTLTAPQVAAISAAMAAL